jgi:hypothetical protein
MPRTARLAAVAAGIVLLSAVQAPPATALEGPNAFTSAALPTAQTNGVVWATATAGGLVLVGGAFTSVRPSGAAPGTSESPRAGFAVLDAATGQPTSCAPAFTFPANPALATVLALDVSPDGRTAYVGGWFSSAGGQAHKNLAALDLATCTVLGGFTPSTNSYVRALRSTSSTLYVGGELTQLDGATRTYAGAVNAVGTASPGALLPWAPAFDRSLRALALKPDGSVLLAGGAFSTANGADSAALVALDPASAATVRAYPRGSFPTDNTSVKAIAVDATGFYTGSEGAGANNFDGRVAFDWTTLNQRWRDDCLGATQAVVVYRDLLYSGSHAHNCSLQGWFPDGERHHLMTETTSGAQVQPWFPNTNDGLGEQVGPRALVVARSGGADYLWVAGEFTTVNGVNQQGLTRFGQGADTAGPSAPTTSATSLRPGQVQVSWRASNDTDDATLTYRVYRDGGSTPVRTVTAASWFWSRQQLDWIDTGLAKGSTHSYRVTASDGTTTTSASAVSVKVASAASTYAETVLADGASQLWRYDELSDVLVADSSGSGRSGVLSGRAGFQVSPAAIPQDTSRAMSLAGMESLVVSSLRSPGPTTWTEETWFQTTTTTGGVILGFGEKQTILDVHGDRQVFMGDNGQVSFGVSVDDGYSAVITSARSYNDGLWHHVAATHDGTGMTLFLDGTRVSHGTETRVRPQDGYWRVGGDDNENFQNGPTDDYFTGTVDETAIYPTALTASQVLSHYALGGGTTVPGPADFYGRTVYQEQPDLQWRLGETCCPYAYDATGADNRGVYHGGVSYGTAGAVSGTTDTALTINTNNSYVSSLAASPSPSAFTEEVWVYANLAASGQVFGFGDAFGVSSTVDRVVYVDSLGRLVFGVRTGATRTTVTSSQGLPANTWHHVLASKGPAGMQLWVDGVLKASNTVTAEALSYNGFWHTGGDTLAGWPNAPVQNYLGGRIDEFAVYPAQLPAKAVAAHFSAGRWSVADAAPPTVPAPVGVSVTGGDATLSWPASIDNVGVTGYQVFRSPTPGFTPGPATLLATVTSPRYVDAGAPTGPSYYLVQARDAQGNQSASSAQITAFLTDVTPPSTPTGVAASTTPTSASLSWTASTDNAAVTGYVVHRSTTSGFSPSASTVVGSTTSPGFTEPLGPGTYYYRVLAQDGAGNLSSPSAQAAATVAAAPAPTTTTLSPTADTFANAGAPSTSYGSSTTLTSRGSPGAVAYLRFVLPPAPAGMTLTSAVLSLRTTTDSTSGSAATQAIAVASDTWNEAALTWNNRPALTSIGVGTVPGGTATSSAFSVPLDPAAMASLLGTQSTLGMTSTSSDALSFWSSNQATASYRPRLVLTFSP